MDAFPPNEIAYQTARFHENRSTLVIAVSSIFTAAAVVLFILRITARRVARANLGWDDYLSVGATLSLIGVNISACLMAHYGIGRHLLYVAQNPENFVRIGKATLAFSVSYDCSMALGKLAVLALFARIFTVSSQTIRFGVYFFAAYTIAWWTAGMFIIFFQCRPLSSNWGEPHQCRPKFRTSVAFGVLNALSDMGILALPQPAIWKLHLSSAKKIALSFAFLIGGFATVVSIARIPLLKGANSGADLDSTYSSVNGILFTVIEPACVVLCGCMPMLPGLFRRLIKPTPNTTNDFSSRERVAHSRGFRGMYSWEGSRRLASSDAGTKLKGRSSVSESTEAFELTHSVGYPGLRAEVETR